MNSFNSLYDCKKLELFLVVYMNMLLGTNHADFLLKQTGECIRLNINNEVNVK